MYLGPRRPNKCLKKSDTHTRRMSSNKKMTAQAKLERKRVKHIAGANKKQGR